MTTAGKVWGTVVCMGVFGGLWFLFVMNVSKYEQAGAVVCAGLATVATLAFAGAAKVPFRPTVGMVLEAWRLPWMMVKGTWELAAALAGEMFSAGGMRSEVRAVRWRACGEDSRDAARRALAIGYATATPNIVVLGVVKEEGVMLIHQVKEGEVPAVLQRLGAEVKGGGGGA